MDSKYAAAATRVDSLSAALQASDERVQLLEGGLWAESRRADSLYVRVQDLQQRLDSAQITSSSAAATPSVASAFDGLGSFGVASALERLAQLFASIARACDAVGTGVGTTGVSTTGVGSGSNAGGETIVSDLPMPTHPLGHPLALTLLATSSVDATSSSSADKRVPSQWKRDPKRWTVGHVDAEAWDLRSYGW